MQKCNDVTVRYAAPSDAAAVASYIWQTDEYIYPAAVNSPDDGAWVDFIARSLADENSVYFHGRVLVAEVCGKVVGACAFFRCGENLHFALPVDGSIREGIEFVDCGYYRPLVEESRVKEGIYISNLCVDKAYRGRGIGTKLLDGLIALFPDCDIVLDVLEDNPAARRLYEKEGFTVTKHYFGFSGRAKMAVPCLEMVRRKSV